VKTDQRVTLARARKLVDELRVHVHASVTVVGEPYGRIRASRAAGLPITYRVPPRSR